MKKYKFNSQQSGFSPLGFTLLEIMIGILIFSIVIVGGFKAYSSVLIGKIKLIESTNIQKQAFYFSEKFFEEIKVGGTIDYEEFFNREVVGTSTLSGHYDKPTGFGNYGINGNILTTTYGYGFYFCRSNSGALMGTGGCVENFNNIKSDGTSENVKDKMQRYGQYSFQFIDYNSNTDDDTILGDEDGDGKIIGDDDDEYLGMGPVAFSGSEVKEIYLISADKKKRTFFRWNIKQDEIKTSETRGTIEFLKLEGKDWGFNHAKTGDGLYDGVIDTWLIDKEFTGGAEVIAGSGDIDAYWQPLFGENVNVKDFKIFAYPNKDKNLAWQDTDLKINFNPYLRIQMVLTPSYQARKGFRGKIPEIKINTTINLTDIYSR
ncbi:MAG: prepilin-type N-terminal cleavage/methylation domain-containing protein [Candidatus Gracilibacteria bacterium]|nr:prepilin-type N-terminal cleavage/methylation domain-containing protein [Candidatus Gracilibacteria bacterium]MDQ7022670.1 prepilin-type N-terminal cleavage/methylation domain-containing protein [Candidatus Gracilibacteria bacterium]